MQIVASPRQFGTAFYALDQAARTSPDHLTLRLLAEHLKDTLMYSDVPIEARETVIFHWALDRGHIITKGA